MDKDCSVYRTADFIGKRWTLLILLELYKGNKKKRYSQIKNNLQEITPKILSARLKELEKHKLINKKVDAKTFPVKCEYSLTKKGEDFIDVIKEIKQWTLKYDYNKECNNRDCIICRT